MIDAMHDGVVVHAADGSIVAFNERATILLGLTADQFRGRSAIDPLWRVEHLDGSLMAQEELPTNTARLTGQSVIDGSFWLRVGDGPRKLITGCARPIGGDGIPTPCPVMVTFRDITHIWEQSERARRADTLATVIDLSFDGIVVIDAHERIQLANPAFARLLQVDHPASLVGSDFSTLVARGDQQPFEQRLRTLLASHPAVLNDPAEHRFTLQLLTRQGEFLATELSMACMTWRGGPAIVCVVRDDSARQQLEGEVRQLQKVEAIGAFAMGIAHDFANVLQIIGGASRALEHEVRHAGPSASAADAIDNLQHAIARGTEMTRHLLAFVRRTPRKASLIDPCEEIRAIAGMLRRLLPDRMGLTLDLATDGGLLRMHRTDLEQVLLNLVVNARNAMGDVGTITIRSVELPDHRLQVEVIDDGPGMPASVGASPVNQDETDSGASPGGTGLGLSIVRRIVGGAKGEFAIESGPEGTVCRVILPTEPLTARTTVITPRYVRRIEA